MEVFNLFTTEPTDQARTSPNPKKLTYLPPAPHPQGSPTRQRRSGHVSLTSPSREFEKSSSILPVTPGAMNAHSIPKNAYPALPGSLPKKVAFELLLDGGSKTRARIPMRVLINSHDTTESIITTVKNFYGIYEGHGVSFEDEKGNTLIARYENFMNDMVVYVRTVSGPTQFPNGYSNQGTAPSDQHTRTSLGEPFQMLPPHLLDHYPTAPSRPTSRLAQKKSGSPQPGRGRRSASQQKAGSLTGTISRGSSAHGSYLDDAANGYSDSDGGQGSVTSSRKARSEPFASAEISLENVLQDGRRKKPNFESSELPLFIPPQVPITTSTSSISPQRRSVPQEGPSRFALPAQKLYAHQSQPFPSPQSHSYGDQPAVANGVVSYTNPSLPQHGHRLRDRSQMSTNPLFDAARPSYNAQGILPTPDPTIASCISDEDVARQLIALGDASNFSSHGRTSASTFDDAFSGAADVASSTGATSDSGEYSEDEVNLPKSKSRTYSKGDDDEEYEHDAMIKSEFEEFNGGPKPKKIKTKSFDGSSNKTRIPKLISTKNNKRGKSHAETMPKTSRPIQDVNLMRAPTAAATNPTQSRKSSSSSTTNFQHQLRTDEEDLSSKPRCQRCRKSKKGCDRQRPCQRCKDAGIGIEGCISEDEGNGRKGRYGRVMGVPLKKTGDAMSGDEDFQTAGAILTEMASAQRSPEKNKKRKR